MRISSTNTSALSLAFRRPSEKDTSVTMDEVADLARKMESAGVTYEIQVYSGPPHGFTEFNSERYQKRADEQSWDAFVSGFDGVFDKSLAFRVGALAILLAMRRASSWVSTLAMWRYSGSRVSRSRDLRFQFLSAACSEASRLAPLPKGNPTAELPYCH